VIDFIAPLLAIDGYGHSAQNIVLALDKLGVDVRFVAHDWLIDTFSKPRLLELTKKEGKAETGIVYHLPPTLKQYRDKYKKLIAFTMWETTKLSPLWVQCLNHYADAVFVPSEFCKKVFEESGVKRPIHVVPLGIDLEQYKYYDRPDYREKFRFLITGKMDSRKNYQAVVKAFLDEFPKNDDIELVIKTRGGSVVDVPKDDRIKVIAEDYSPDDLLHLYYDCDCFVYPSKGEGYGLPPREAMATGLPVIMTNFGSMVERVDPYTFYPIPVIMMEKVDYPTKHLISLEDQDLGEWVIPDIWELKQAMRKVYNNRAEAKQRGKMAAMSIKRNADPMNGALAIKRLV
jgi:glycosyltransferase involved in cell wall biosynthesis